MFSKLKNILSEIHLPLALEREYGKVFEMVSTIAFRTAKSLKDILVREKVAPVKSKKVYNRSCRGSRYEIRKHVVTIETFTSFSTRKKYCSKSDNLKCRSSNILFYVRNFKQVVLKGFDSDLTITNQPIGILLMEIPSNKRHFTLTAWYDGLGNYPHWPNRSAVEESLSGSMNSTHSNQIDLMSVMQSSFDVFTSLTFR